jgi:hypothetical protein
MHCKPSVFVAICLIDLGLCLTPGCGSNAPPATTSSAPGYFGKVGQGPGEALELDLKAKAQTKAAVPAK